MASSVKATSKMENKFETILNKFNESNQTNCIDRLKKILTWIETNMEESEVNQTKLLVLDRTLDLFVKNGWEFKTVLCKSNYEFCNRFKDKVKLYYATVDESIYPTIEADLLKENAETMVKCRYYWNKFKRIHNEKYNHIQILERRMMRCRAIKDLYSTIDDVITVLDDMVLNGELDQAKYDSYLIQLSDKALAIKNAINGGVQDEKFLLRTMKKAVKYNNRVQEGKI